MADWLVVVGIIALALAFDFVNGFHDAANSIATVVSTRVLSPRWAVVWAAFFNLVAFLIFPASVAVTIGKGVVSPDAVTIPVITAGLVGATIWDLVTWYWAIPASSSHALVGGLAGAACVYAGWGSLIPSGLLLIGLFIFVAPILGLVVGFCVMIATYWLFRKATPKRVGGLFRKLQLCSAAAYSLGHGGNDAQKTMGIIAIVLIASGRLTHGEVVPEHLPLWIVLACQTAMGLGTLCGGWRIVKTMGQKICVLQPVHGFAAETSGSACLYLATWLGIPVSTTHTITGSIMGVGLTRGLKAVKWGVARRVLWAWVLTIPASGVAAALTWHVFEVCGWRALPTPAQLQAEPAGPGRVRLHWEGCGAQHRYLVYRYAALAGGKQPRKLHAAPEDSLIDLNTEAVVARDLETPEWLDSGLKNGTEYFYRVRATARWGRFSLPSKAVEFESKE